LDILQKTEEREVIINISNSIRMVLALNIHVAVFFIIIKEQK